jgi:hypothetical protein
MLRTRVVEFIAFSRPTHQCQPCVCHIRIIPSLLRELPYLYPLFQSGFPELFKLQGSHHQHVPRVPTFAPSSAPQKESPQVLSSSNTSNPHLIHVDADAKSRATSLSQSRQQHGMRRILPPKRLVSSNPTHFSKINLEVPDSACKYKQSSSRSGGKACSF